MQNHFISTLELLLNIEQLIDKHKLEKKYANIYFSNSFVFFSGVYFKQVS